MTQHCDVFAVCTCGTSYVVRAVQCEAPAPQELMLHWPVGVACSGCKRTAPTVRRLVALEGGQSQLAGQLRER